MMGEALRYLHGNCKGICEMERGRRIPVCIYLPLLCRERGKEVERERRTDGGREGRRERGKEGEIGRAHV